MKITISVSGKLPQGAVGRPVGSAERVLLGTRPGGRFAPAARPGTECVPASR